MSSPEPTVDTPTKHSSPLISRDDWLFLSRSTTDQFGQWSRRRKDCRVKDPFLLGFLVGPRWPPYITVMTFLVLEVCFFTVVKVRVERDDVSQDSNVFIWEVRGLCFLQILPDLNCFTRFENG